MKPSALLLVVPALLLVATGCGSEGTDAVATDPDGPTTSGASDTPSDAPSDQPTTADRPVTPAPDAPVPAGEVTTRFLSTVIADASRPAPELCLGPVEESYPPGCRGIPLVGWAWDQLDGVFDSQGETRWGSFAVTGRFDGTSMTVTSSVPAALYDAAPATEPPLPTPATVYPESELQEMATALVDQVPGALNAYATPTQVVVDVVYDDGTLQGWADDTFGAGVVVLTPALLDLSDL